ncbi:hypothetical protein PFLUV_G00233910 [Perca fluviatilis]|uniref:Uncharacterized protein n=1 Tax=Perca fluviatilis TaxID=8168 RepID=A0A6A5DYB7_PERFL|nr:hypothetical protein PFLUV_G00233910 [Perca fluviatilis]
MDPPFSTGHCGAAIRISGTEEDNLTSTETRNNSFLILRLGRDCRDGGVHLFSTIGQTGHSSTGRMIQEGFLEAQTALSQQAHRHRRARFRQAREHRRHKVVYPVNVGETNTEGIQRLKLVRRSTERDIFLDESTGESLDPSCLLDSKSLPHLCEARQRNQPDKQLLCSREDEIQIDRTQGPTNREEITQQTGHRGLSLDQNLVWTTEREIVRIEDRGKTQRDSWM